MEKEKIIEIFKNKNINISKIETAGNSYNSNVYIVYDNKNNKYIFKILNNELKRLTEQKYYNYLNNYLPTSKVIDSGCINNINYNIITFFDGKNTYDEKANELSKNKIYNLGKLLASIHTCPIIDIDDDTWIEYLLNYIENANNNLGKLIGDDNNKLISTFLINYIEQKLRNNYQNCILHMDYRIGNVIFKNKNIIGIIDLESMRNGDYVFDFVKLNRTFNKENFRIFKEGYESVKPIDKTFDERLSFYSFFDAYTSLYWCQIKNKIDSDYYKTNYSIVKKYLRKIKDEKWNL